MQVIIQSDACPTQIAKVRMLWLLACGRCVWESFTSWPYSAKPTSRITSPTREAKGVNEQQPLAPRSDLSISAHSQNTSVLHIYRCPSSQ